MPPSPGTNTQLYDNTFQNATSKTEMELKSIRRKQSLKRISSVYEGNRFSHARLPYSWQRVSTFVSTPQNAILDLLHNETIERLHLTFDFCQITQVSPWVPYKTFATFIRSTHQQPPFHQTFKVNHRISNTLGLDLVT